MKSVLFLLLLLSMVVLLSSNSEKDGVSHQFSEGQYHPICDSNCFMEFGYMEISSVTDKTLHIDIEVWNQSLHSGSLDCIAEIADPYRATYTEDHGPDIGISIFEFTVDSNYPNNINVRYDGPSMIYSGMRICLEGSFNLD